MSSGRMSAHHAKGVQHAKVKHPAAKQGLLVLIGCSFSPQPNLAFNRDVKASHCRPLTLALGFWWREIQLYGVSLVIDASTV